MVDLPSGEFAPQKEDAVYLFCDQNTARTRVDFYGFNVWIAAGGHMSIAVIQSAIFMYATFVGETTGLHFSFHIMTFHSINFFFLKS